MASASTEALVLWMIEVAQRADMVGLLKAAAMLLDVEELGDVLQASQSLATSLRRCGLFVRAPATRRGLRADLCPRRQLH